MRGGHRSPMPHLSLRPHGDDHSLMPNMSQRFSPSLLHQHTFSLSQALILQHMKAESDSNYHNEGLMSKMIGPYMNTTNTAVTMLVYFPSCFRLRIMGNIMEHLTNQIIRSVFVGLVLKTYYYCIT